MKQFLNERKAITLIALVITIIVLVVLAGVTLSVVLKQDGLIQKANSSKLSHNIETAKEQLEIIKATVKLDKYNLTLDDYLDELNKVKNKYEINDIEKISNTQAEIVVSGKYKFLVTDTTKGDLVFEYQGEATELILSAMSGTYTYPTVGTFEVVKNITGGELSVKSENENIAKATINGKIVTVEPGITAGTTKIIVTAAAKGKYASQKVVYTATVENGTIELEATEYIGNYDGQTHDAITNLKVNPIDAKVEYSLNGGEYSEVIPQVTGINTYTISIRVSKEGYTTNTISKTVIINEGILSVNAVGFEGEYDGTAHGINVTCDGATITYSTIEGGTYTITNPMYTDVGTYTTYYKVEKEGYKTVTGSETISIIHTHTGDETTGGGCYTKVNYHVHSSTCGKACTGQWKLVYGSHYQHKCTSCGRVIQNSYLADQDGTKGSICTKHYGSSCGATVYTCGKTPGKTIDSYSLGCGF